METWKHHGLALSVMKSRVTIRDLIGRRSRGGRDRAKTRRARDLIELNARADLAARRERMSGRKREKEKKRKPIDKV